MDLLGIFLFGPFMIFAGLVLILIDDEPGWTKSIAGIFSAVFGGWMIFELGNGMLW